MNPMHTDYCVHWYSEVKIFIKIPHDKIISNRRGAAIKPMQINK